MPEAPLTEAKLVAAANFKRQETQHLKERASNGMFLPGAHGNPKGRPKGTGKKKSEAVDPAVAIGNIDLPVDFHEKVGTDALQALKELLATARTRREAHMLAKDLLAYQQPRLTSSESKVEKTTSFNVVWSDAPPLIEGDVLPMLERK